MQQRVPLLIDRTPWLEHRCSKKLQPLVTGYGLGVKEKVRVRVTVRVRVRFRVKVRARVRPQQDILVFQHTYN